jgi:hypothetical protein
MTEFVHTIHLVMRLLCDLLGVFSDSGVDEARSEADSLQPTKAEKHTAYAIFMSHLHGLNSHALIFCPC